MVRLLGRIGQKPCLNTQGFTSKEVPQYNEDTDEILDILNEKETPVETQGVNFDLSNVNDQIQSMEKDFENHTYTLPAKLSSSNEYSNFNFEKAPCIQELPDDEIYNLSNYDGMRKIEIIKEI